MVKYIRNNKEINTFQYTQKFKSDLISNECGEFSDTMFIVISGMCDTEFEWDSTNKTFSIVYSNYNNFYENVTEENFRSPEIINLNDYIIKEDGIYHIETKEFFEKSINKI